MFTRILLGMILTATALLGAEGVRLFDGKTFKGWEGNLKFFRIEEGAVVAGNLKTKIPRNEFLCTKKKYDNFVLKLEAKLVGGDRANAGIQIRTKRIPDHHEVSGYQADMGQGWWGSLYDESRRRTMLAKADPAVIKKVLKPKAWNQYEIRCEGPRIRLFLNGVLTVDYVEKDAKIPLQGIIGLQIHSGPPTEAWYRNIWIRELKK